MKNVYQFKNINMKMNTVSTTSNSKFMKAFLSILFLLNIAISFGQKAEFKVQNDRVNRSTTTKGTFYKMVLTNNGQSDTYELSSSNVNGKSTNPDASKVTDNVELRVQFEDKNMRPITQLKINAGETIEFFAHIEVPPGTPTDKWSSNKVTAQSKANSNYKVDTILHTIVNTSND